MRKYRSLSSILFASTLTLAATAVSAASLPKVQTYSSMPLRGVNLSGGAFSDDGNGLAPQGNFLPRLNDASLFIYRGMNTFRIPVAWEYLANIDGSFKKTEAGQQYLAKLTRVINDLTSKGATVIIDLHNYMRYNPSNISLDYQNHDPKGSDVIGYGSQAPTTEAYAALWKNIVKKFHETNVVYDIMNEPHDMSMELVIKNQNAAIEAIRAEENALTISKPHLILVEGNYWTGLHSWTGLGQSDKEPNSTMYPHKIKDPKNNIAIEVHQYFDAESSGTYVNKDCLTPEEFENGYNNQGQKMPGFNEYWLQFTKWVKQNKVKVFLGEFGAPDTPNCRADLKYTLDHLKAFEITSSKDYGFLGWSVWAAGGAWGNYVLSIAPGGPANSLMWNDALYQNYLTEKAPLPPLGAKAAKLINNTDTPLLFSGGNWPFQKEGSATLNPGDTVYLYSPNNSLSPGKQIELSYHVGDDQSQVLGFGVTEKGYGYSYGQIGNIKIGSEQNCMIKPKNGDKKRCWQAIAN